MEEPTYPLTVEQQKRMVFLLRKYLATAEHRPGARGVKWDLTKCDEAARRFLGQIGAEW